MGKQRQIYSGRDVAFIIPTKDRPDKMKNLLDSLARQTIGCGRVIIVDGGQSVKNIVMGFSGCLPVEYYECHPPGQIRQRNMGISKLNSKALLVGCIDDDMIFEHDALGKMVNCWNSVEENTAGVGFNIINTPPYRYSFFRGLLLMSSPKQGRVLSSGYCVPIQNAPKDIRTQWLGGGYTVWKRWILENFPQDNLNTRWATGEDLRFSYPIGKKYPLYVCAAAKVHHDHIYDQVPNKTIHRYIGRKGSLGFFYFVSSHRELSNAACLWMLTGIAFSNFVYGCATFSSRKLGNALGQAEAILICLKEMMGYTNLRTELED